MKLLMNFIGMWYGALYSEAVVLGAKIGISPQTIRDVIGPSRMGNGFFETFMRYVVDRDRTPTNSLSRMLQRTFATSAIWRRMLRMVDIMASAARHYYAHVEAIGRAEDYVPMLSDHVGALNGVNMENESKKNSGK